MWWVQLSDAIKKGSINVLYIYRINESCRTFWKLASCGQLGQDSPTSSVPATGDSRLDRGDIFCSLRLLYWRFCEDYAIAEVAFRIMYVLWGLSEFFLIHITECNAVMPCVNAEHDACLLLPSERASASFARSDCTRRCSWWKKETNGRSTSRQNLAMGTRVCQEAGHRWAQATRTLTRFHEVSIGILCDPIQSTRGAQKSISCQLIKSLETPFPHAERLSYCRCSFLDIACRPDSAKSGTGVPDSVSVPRSCHMKPLIWWLC